METGARNIYYRETKELVNIDTGEVVAEQRVTKARIAQEPQFIKLYLSHVLMLSDIPKGLNEILFELLRKMNYDNEIVWNKGIKQRICKRLGCSESNVRKAITEFKKKKILIEQVQGVFLVNPYIFGRGSWDNVQQLRLTVDITPTQQIISGTVFNDDYRERIDTGNLTNREVKELSSIKSVFSPSCCPNSNKSEEEACGLVTFIEKEKSE